MKSHRHPQRLPQASLQILTDVNEIWSVGRKQKLPTYLFLALCVNAVFAPAVFAATGGELDRLQSWALALLGIATISLSAYLFTVMFQPEKF